MRALSLSGALAMLLLSQSVPAAFMTFSDRTTFEAVLGSLVIDDYSNAGYVFLQSDVVMSNVLGETEYMSTGFVDWNLIPGEYYCAGCNGSFELAFTTTSVGNATGVFGVGFEFFNAVSPEYVAYVTFGNAATTNIPLPSAPSNFSSGAFFGITASELITSIHFGLPNGGATTSGSFGIDNLTIGSVLCRNPPPFCFWALA